MKTVLFSVVSIVLSASLITGCAQSTPTNPTLSNTTGSDWANLDDATKLNLVKQEFKNIKYTGTIKPSQVVSQFETLTAQDSSVSDDLSIKENVDIALESLVSQRGQDKISQDEDAKVPANVEIAHIQKYLKGPDGSVLARLHDDVYLKDFNDKIKELKSNISKEKAHEQELKQKIASCPLKLVKAYVQPDSINTPEAYAIVTNISHKAIDAYKIAFYCYDSFGDPVNDIASDNNSYYAIKQGYTLYPGQTYGYDWSWMLATQDTTTKVTAEIIDVHFTDGTKWSLQ